LANSIAGASAEKSPVVLISGAPGIAERADNPLLQHRVREWRTQLEVFDTICLAMAEIVDPATAFRDIDRLLDICHHHKGPVSIELPRDMVAVVPDQIRPYVPPPRTSDAAALAEAVAEAKARIEAAKRPIAATMLAKSVISEVHPLSIGLYEGAMGR
jgi:indolepyruvate decarboxylase